MVAVAALLAADLMPPAAAQSEDETTGRIVARRLATGRVEFGWQPPSGERVLPQSRYFPADPGHNRWLRSSPVEVGGMAIGRIEARLRSDGRIEFAFTPTDGERILTRSRYFPTTATVERGWLRSTEITFTIGPPSGSSDDAYRAVSAGRSHTCAIRASDSEIVCWGNNAEGQRNAPAGAYRAVSAGYDHTCAIRASDSEIECWGESDDGRTRAASGTYRAVSAGYAHACGLYTNGAIACWGESDDGRTRAPTAPSGYRAVSAGGRHTCAIRESDSEIECWGRKRARADRRAQRQLPRRQRWVGTHLRDQCEQRDCVLGS